MIFITATTTTTTSITVNIHIWLCIYILWKWSPEYKSKQCPVGALRPAANAQQPCKEEKAPDSELPGGKIMGIYWEDHGSIINHLTIIAGFINIYIHLMAIQLESNGNITVMGMWFFKPHMIDGNLMGVLIRKKTYYKWTYHGNLIGISWASF